MRVKFAKINEFSQQIKDCRFTHHSTANCSLKSIQACSSQSEVKGAPSPNTFKVMNIFDLHAFCTEPYILRNWWRTNETCFDDTSRTSAFSENYLKFFNPCTSLSDIDFFEKFDGSKNIHNFKSVWRWGTLNFGLTRTRLY